MFKNYLTIAIRNLKRNKVFSFINIVGLAIGISASLVIYLVVQHEFSFDKFHRDRDQVYRLVTKIEFPDLTIRSSGVPIPTSSVLRNEMSGLSDVIHFFTTEEAKVSVPVAGNQIPSTFRNQKDIIFADEAYFKLFEYKWLAGSRQAALKDPFQVVLTEARAKVYFGSLAPKDILGREISYNDSIKVMVAGIIKGFDQPTDFTFQEFLSASTLKHSGLKNEYQWDEWNSFNTNSQLFVKLEKGKQPAQVLKQLAQLREKYRQKVDARKDDTEHSLQPLADLHFNADYDIFGNRLAHRPTLYGLLAVASFLLLLGCINFINLTTAHASRRAKEIGIRKTIGSGKKQLVMQFLSETFLLTFLATVLSVLISPWLLKIFSDFIPQGIGFSSLNQVHVYVFLLTLIVIVTFLSGLYPAFVLTKFKPVAVLKSQAGSGLLQTRKAWLRKTLTVTQFVIAQFLIIATLVVSKQVHYSLTKDLGFKKDAIVFFNTRWNFFSTEIDNRRFTLLEKLRSIPEIEKISLSGSSPSSNNTSSTYMKSNNGSKQVETMVEMKYADTAYFGLYNMKLVAGKNLLQSDTTKEFLINETYARLLGFANPGDAVGHTIEKGFQIPITGVVADFHTKSTHQAIKPLAYSNASSNSYTVHLALRSRDHDPETWTRALAKAEKAYKELYPEDDFKPTFFDESIAMFYTSEKNISRLLKWSSGLCIFISCLGLLGLVIYITSTRTKEIGVRKVLGASVAQIVSLLSKDFLALVLLAFVIALPIAWYTMHSWLQDFTYRTSLSWWVFGVTGAGMLLIALLVLSIRTVKSAMENPVKSLRTE